jgi:hypothetical protein
MGHGRGVHALGDLFNLWVRSLLYPFQLGYTHCITPLSLSFVGGINKSRTLLRTFLSMLIFFFFFSLGVGIYNLYRIFSHCQDLTDDAGNVIHACWGSSALDSKGGFHSKIFGIIVAVVYGISWIIELRMFEFPFLRPIAHKGCQMRWPSFRDMLLS